jgi:hypothetical protein
MNTMNPVQFYPRNPGLNLDPGSTNSSRIAPLDSYQRLSSFSSAAIGPLVCFRRSERARESHMTHRSNGRVFGRSEAARGSHSTHRSHGRVFWRSERSRGSHGWVFWRKGSTGPTGAMGGFLMVREDQREPQNPQEPRECLLEV